MFLFHKFFRISLEQNYKAEWPDSDELQDKVKTLRKLGNISIRYNAEAMAFA